nr:reverse transcriptase domain-containing protein [Tanacetum cinerariifolium]
MDGCTKGPQLENDENLNTEAPGTGRTPLGVTSGPTGQAQEVPSPAFVKENIDTSEAGSENSQTSPSAEEVGGYSSDGSSRSKSKSVKSKPQSVRASRRKSSLDSSGSEDLSMPYRRSKPMPFTSRIISFRYHQWAKLPPNVRVYEGNKDPEDHLSIFSTATEQEEWPMPVWCKMFRQTLSELSQQKRYDKDPTEIHGIKRKLNEGLQAFIECFKAESAYIKGVPPVFRIFTFMHGRETAVDTTEVIRSPRLQRDLVMDNVNFPPPPSMVGTPEKQNMNKFCDYHQDRGHNTNDCYHLRKQIEEVVALGRLAHLVKDIRQGGQKSKGSAKGKEKVINMVRSQGYWKRTYERVEHWMDNAIMFLVRRIYVNGGSSSEVMYTHCFRNLSYQIRSRLRESRILLVWFSGEVSYSMGVIDSEVTIGECRKTRIVIMEFAMVKSPSPYNALLSRTRMRSLGAVASTIYLMMKFLTLNRIATISTTRETPRECRQIEKAQDLSRHNVDIFTWNPIDMTGILRVIIEHSLDTYPHIKPKAQKKRSLAPDMKKVDLYPFLDIDWKIKSLMGFQYKCFLDAYKGYHQIKRTKKDEEKTAFHTKEGVFCYMKLPFGLKNAGATYQRLVDSAFKEQIGVNLKAYMDDTLKKCTNKKDLSWIEAAEATFLEIKKLVSELPTLTTPKKGETLMMYLAAANEAVSAVLLTERDGRQMPIHYVSRSLEGEETNYVLMEKLALTLVHAARRLRREKLTYGLRTWRLYTDRASNNRGSGADLILLTPGYVEYSYALYLNFFNSNNEAEYEALLARLRIAIEMHVKYIHAFVDSKLVASQVEGSYEAKGERMKKIPGKGLGTTWCIQQVLNERSFKAQEVNMVVEEEGTTWMTSIQNYLEKVILLEDPVDTRTLMEKIKNYTIKDGVLYRKSYLVSLMRYVGPLIANCVIREVHMSSCGMHDGPRHVVAKAMNLGYFWPSMHRDARELIRACDDYQAHASIPRLPKADMISVTSAWPLMK